jgi:hypothetical protein
MCMECHKLYTFGLLVYSKENIFPVLLALKILTGKIWTEVFTWIKISTIRYVKMNVIWFCSRNFMCFGKLSLHFLPMPELRRKSQGGTTSVLLSIYYHFSIWLGCRADLTSFNDTWPNSKWAWAHWADRYQVKLGVDEVQVIWCFGVVVHVCISFLNGNNNNDDDDVHRFTRYVCCLQVPYIFSCLWQ